MVYKIKNQVAVTGGSAVVGALEKEGCLGIYYDEFCPDDRFEQKSWECAETQMQKNCISRLLTKKGLNGTQVDLLFSGDLLNQCTASSFGALPFQIPYIGLYGACSTFAEGVALAALAIDAGAAKRAMCVASSHFCTAERQYRFPLEYGCQHTPTSQRTVTGAGALLLEPAANADSTSLLVREIQFGVIKSFGVKDANNMGAAMAPAAADTLARYFEQTKSKPEDFDLILTGDLGSVGTRFLRELLEEKNFVLGDNYRDCGCEIFHEWQDVHAGASGCGCSAVYVSGYLEKTWRTGMFSDVLLVGTGALLSPLTVMQKEEIPAIAHLVRLSGGGK